MLTKLDGLLSAPRPNIIPIAQVRPRVQEKLDQLKKLDEEIIALLSTKTKLVEEIEHSDEARAPLLAALVNIDMHCSPDASVPSPVRPSRPVAVTWRFDMLEHLLGLLPCLYQRKHRAV